MNEANWIYFAVSPFILILVTYLWRAVPELIEGFRIGRKTRLAAIAKRKSGK